MAPRDRAVAGRYVLTDLLGRGGMGLVWRAHDKVLRRAVAVKEVMFSPSLPETERRSAQARVMREARAAARLNHPGVVTLYDVIHDQGHTFIVMELIEAPNLAILIRERGPLPPQRVAEIGGQLASALEAAHRAGIVHRDVKPGNVMVPEDGGVKLADFGVASLQGDPQLTTTGLVIGSPAYMSPEQASGEQSGPPADFWALGATMYAAVEGEPPFDKGASIPTLAAVVNEDPRPMRRAGPLAWVIGELLTKDPSHRPSGPQVRAQLQRVAGAAPAATDFLPAHREQPPASTTAPLPAAPARALPAPPEPQRQRSPADPAAVPTGKPQAPGGLLPAAPASSAAAEPSAPAQRPAEWGAPVEPAVPEGQAPFPSETLPARPGSGRRGLLVVGLGALLATVLIAWLVGALESPQTPGRAASTTGVAATRPDGTTARAPSTRAPSTKVPSTRAPSTEAPVAGQVPAGWTSFTRTGGAYAVGLPPGWRERTRERYNATVIEAGGRRFTVRSTNPADPLPAASRNYRDLYASKLPGYREIRFDENDRYHGRPAVVFEYEALEGGQRFHVSHVNLKGRTWGYNVEFVTPAAQWDSSQELARQFEQAFRPLG